MFKLRIRNVKDSYGSSKEHLVTDFLQAIGFLGTDGPKARETKRAKTGILLFTKCLIPSPKKSWTTSEIAKELGVPLQGIYRHLQWLREVGFLTEDFPGKAEDPKKVRLWHYDIEKAWAGVENRAKICLETYKEIINNLNNTLKEAKDTIPENMMVLEKEEPFEMDLREINRDNEQSYETDLSALGRGIGLLSNHHYPYGESMPYKILDECFFQRPDRAWTAEEIAAWIETTRPTAYRHLNRLISLGLIERCRATDGGPPTSAFHLRLGSLKKGWQKIETQIEIILDTYKKTITKLKEN
ncbi:MAG TPA: helix-turn-helix domain-containing protein [Candidatus Poseidoniia archaeon]|jgi:predicted transcriptional regulator|nr:helix-turn-helix domain-containing protein [Candidatus Poseidoniia archaeon]|tara:strand:+ start:3807 stop:4703 length:897 start_codon:yes stop_codon:yes gene_type:complete